MPKKLNKLTPSAVALLRKLKKIQTHSVTVRENSRMHSAAKKLVQHGRASIEHVPLAGDGAYASEPKVRIMLKELEQDCAKSVECDSLRAMLKQERAVLAALRREYDGQRAEAERSRKDIVLTWPAALDVVHTETTPFGEHKGRLDFRVINGRGQSVGISLPFATPMPLLSQLSHHKLYNLELRLREVPTVGVRKQDCAASPAPTDEEWTAHDGASMPQFVTGRQYEVCNHDGTRWTYSIAGRYQGSFYWQSPHPDSPRDVVKYRLVPAPVASECSQPALQESTAQQSVRWVQLSERLPGMCDSVYSGTEGGTTAYVVRISGGGAWPVVMSRWVIEDLAKTANADRYFWLEGINAVPAPVLLPEGFLEWCELLEWHELKVDQAAALELFNAVRVTNSANS